MQRWVWCFPALSLNTCAIRSSFGERILKSRLLSYLTAELLPSVSNWAGMITVILALTSQRLPLLNCILLLGHLHVAEKRTIMSPRSASSILPNPRIKGASFISTSASLSGKRCNSCSLGSTKPCVLCSPCVLPQGLQWVVVGLCC